MNNPIIWGKFCDTYEALYNRFGDFDSWYARNGGSIAISPLQGEWQAYMRVVLDTTVNNSRGAFDILYALRRYVAMIVL